MKVTLTLAAVLAVLSIALFAHSEAVPMDFDKAHPAYAKGVNDALDAITLLSLEQRLEGTNRTWGAMADIVRERLHVEKRQ